MDVKMYVFYDDVYSTFHSVALLDINNFFKNILFAPFQIFAMCIKSDAQKNSD